ncbi:hypothetical protein EDD22DRAFT_959925 [Suillus occidentalis]|nr:hypothetical protein EDD22DRAFT_959925 [Suillus occidentalis]
MVLPLAGLPAFSIDFIGYLSIGPQPTLYHLYSPPNGHAALRKYIAPVDYVLMPIVHFSAFEISPSTEVPIFVLANRDDAVPALNLPWVQGRLGIDTLMHGVYSHDGVAREHEVRTIIHHAAFPVGFYSTVPDVCFPTSEVDIASLSDTFGHGHSVQNSSMPVSWMGSVVNTVSAGPSSVLGMKPTDTQAQPKKKAASGQLSIHKIMKTCPKWRKALAYLRLMIRIEICLGRTENPHLLVTSEYAERRCLLIRSIWPRCLIKADVTSEELETVLTTVTQLPMSHNDVLLMVNPWLSQFLYDTRRVVIQSMDDARAGFDLGSGALWGIALRDKVLGLVQMFVRPCANLLPIASNGFALFAKEQIAKEIVYHVVFRTTSTCRIRLVMADIDAAAFRHAPHPPVDTLALLGSTCYQALMSKLVNIWGVNDVMPNFPTVSQVHQELRESIFLLLLQQNDPDFPAFNIDLRKFCTITEADLPDSLFATASVLFAWVDSHDLMAFLDVSLREVAMRKRLQQEEQPMFFPGGVRCLMQDRMLRAQMEVSLFSNAIANACEELETRSHTDTHTTNPENSATVRPAENVGACLAPSLVRLGCFQPSNDIVDKCNTWLLASSYSQHTTKVNVNREFDSPHTLGPEYLPISKDTFLFLPAFLKAWVNQITYCTYMSASLAETKPPRLNTRHSFKAKESKNLDVLRSEIHILDLKKHRAQTEVDMLSEATSRIAESEAPSDSSDGSSGSASDV